MPTTVPLLRGGKISVSQLPNQVVLENELGAISVQRIPNTIARVSQIPAAVKVATATVGSGGTRRVVSRNVASAVRRSGEVSRVTFTSGFFTRNPTITASLYNEGFRHRGIDVDVLRFTRSYVDIQVLSSINNVGRIDAAGFTMIAIGNE